MDFFSKYKFSVWLVILLIILNIATLIFMWTTFYSVRKPPPPPRERDKLGMFENLKQEIGLDDNQAIIFDKITKKHFEETKQFGDSIQFYKTQLINESFSTARDTAKIMVLSEKIGQAQSEIERSMSNHLISISKICRPEQLVKLKDLLERIKPKPPRYEPKPPHEEPFRN